MPYVILRLLSLSSIATRPHHKRLGDFDFLGQEADEKHSSARLDLHMLQPIRLTWLEKNEATKIHQPCMINPPIMPHTLMTITAHMHLNCPSSLQTCIFQ